VGEVEMVRDYLDAPPPPSANGASSITSDHAHPIEAREPPPASIAIAAEKSLAASLLPRLPGSYRQMLGRRFDDGVDLSGGCRQRDTANLAVSSEQAVGDHQHNSTVWPV